MSERYDGQTFYEILEVKPTAGPAEIYAAYQRARSTYSPSSPALYSMFSPAEAQELMALIEEAYQTLSHQARRREYDVKIGLAKPPVKSAAVEKRPAPAAKADQWVGPVKVMHSQREQTPEGFGRTKFGTYEISPEMEAEIVNMSECDGSFLRKVRVYKGVSLEQLSDEIRVIKSTLAALENNELEILPVAVFTRGFVVHFARALGLDERKVSDAYMRFFRSKRK